MRSSTVTPQSTEATMFTTTSMNRLARSPTINDYEIFRWISFSVQIFTGIFVIGCFLWFICVTRGGAYFTKRSISDCHMHMILFAAMSALLFFCSLVAYFMFGAFFMQFGIYFSICGIYSMCMIAALLLLKQKFQNRCKTMIKLNHDIGSILTEREAMDLCRIKDYYEKTRKSTNWQRPFFSKSQLEAWSRYLAIADLTGEKQQALQQIIGEMRRGPLITNWNPSYFQSTAHPIPAISNYVDPVNGPPAYCP
ncbi:hypothetical protein M3Y97_00616000 [Aphelenchoides bicaudatus]|nr:hypothetical protein M3Y97_00616000 [Aphelenchoides bicaudatus]